ncbi:MAG: excinuclease subunit, partial [Bacteroidota bacterium]|nr:excinuclease subunit [Bacteroidota bacterium]
MNSEIENTLKIIPHNPGCYQFLDEKGKVIYVGKAKDLKRRVSSYFNKFQDNPKTRVLVKNIRQIKYIVVNSEEESFLLENNLIKQLKPRYNVMLKDDKTYPSIVVKNEYFPRVYKTRNIVRDGSKYFGPYTSVMSVNALIDIFRKVYHVRTCRLNLTPENIAAGKFKVCLEYHIKRCQGPCEGYQSLEDYNKNIEEIVEILKGNVGIVEKQLQSKMQQYAEELRFEEAQALKEKYLLIQNFREKSQVVSNLNYNLDVFGYDDDENSA